MNRPFLHMKAGTNVRLKSGAVRTAGWFEVHACQLWVSLEDDVGPMICIVTVYNCGRITSCAL